MYDARLTADTFSATVHGKPEPAGSKTAFTNPKTGRAIITDANRKSKPWKQLVAQTVGELFDGEPWRGPIKLELTFYTPRPRGHYGTGRNVDVLKPSAPPYPTVKPDALKLARGVEDALTGIVYVDDSQVVDGSQSKRYGAARVEIRVSRL